MVTLRFLDCLPVSSLGTAQMDPGGRRTSSPALSMLRVIVFLGCLLGFARIAAAQETLRDNLPDSDLMAIVDSAIAAKKHQAPATCTGADVPSAAGLTVRDGLVVAADIIKEIGGYAATSQTTGGLGGRLVIVSTTKDSDPAKREKPIAGSLREALENALRDKVPTWITFDPALGPRARITLTQSLRVPSNVTIDGSCADVTLEAPNSTNTILLFIGTGVQNVVITRLALRKTDYFSELNPDNDSAIRINGDVDRIAVLHNDLFECGDGCIDITYSRGAKPSGAHITVAYNFIHDHDKVMLFGTADCNEGIKCDQEYFERSRHAAPMFNLTLEGNLFLRTGQRHPLVWGRVMAHVFANVVAFQPFPRPKGGLGSADGVFVANAARALVEHNLYAALPPRRQPPLAIWTIASPGAMKSSVFLVGFARLHRNRVLGGAVAAEYQPQEVPNPPYDYHSPALETLSPGAAIACLANRAGRTGAASWHATLCHP